MHIEKKEQFTPVSNAAGNYLKGLANLPPAPILVTKLLALFRNPDCDVDQVVQLISYEPSLTVQILRLCNSAYAAGEQPPGDIFEAVSRIGYYKVYCMVVSLFGSKTKSMEGVKQGVDVEELWRHSVAVAVSASIVAEETGLIRAVGFTAGLLHDIGKLVLASSEREAYARLIQSARDEGALLTNLEHSAYGVDHSELGGELMRWWNLPADIVVAVRCHHTLDCATPHEQLTAAVQIGDMIAHHLFEEDLANTDLLTPSMGAVEKLRLGPDEISRLMAKTRTEMDKVKSMLEI